MTVYLTQPVLGQDVGYAYTGNLEAWLEAEGYAAKAAVPDAWGEDSDGARGAFKPAVTVTPTAATLAGGTNAVNLTASGNLVLSVGHKTFTVALTSGDTPAQAATKIDTALAGYADAAIVSSKLNVVSTATGPDAYVVVESGGNATILGNLGLTEGQKANGGDGRGVGASNLGAQAAAESVNPGTRENREAPYWPTTPDKQANMANDSLAKLGLGDTPTLKFPAPGYDYDAAGTDTEAPSDVTLEPAEGTEGDVIQVFGRNLEGVTAVKFKVGAAAAYVDGDDIDLDSASEGIIYVTVPAADASFEETAAVDVLLDDGSTDTTLTGGFLYVVEA